MCVYLWKALFLHAVWDGNVALQDEMGNVVDV